MSAATNNEFEVPHAARGPPTSLAPRKISATHAAVSSSLTDANMIVFL